MRTPLTAVLLSAIVISGCQPQVGTDRWQGYIEAEPLYAASAVAGPLLQVPLQPGQQLQPGDLLFVLDPAPYLAAVAEAQALLAQAAAQRDDLALGARSEELAVLEARQQQAVAALALAKAQFERQQQLLARSLTSREAFDQAKANLDSQRQQLAGAEAALASARLAGRDDAQRAAAAAVDAATARLQQAQWQLNQSRQQAQEPATVAEVLFRPGEMVNAGQPVAVLHPHDRRRIRFYLPQQLRPQWQPGDALRVSCDGCRPFSALVSHIADSVSYAPQVIYSEQQRSKLVFLVEARVDASIAPRLPVGQPVTVMRAGTSDEPAP